MDASSNRRGQPSNLIKAPISRLDRQFGREPHIAIRQLAKVRTAQLFVAASKTLLLPTSRLSLPGQPPATGRGTLEYFELK
jgi:hypothetical protein